jgi:hypothetical protein
MRHRHCHTSSPLVICHHHLSYVAAACRPSLSFVVGTCRQLTTLAHANDIVADVRLMSKLHLPANLTFTISGVQQATEEQRVCIIGYEELIVFSTKENTFLRTSQLRISLVLLFIFLLFQLIIAQEDT